MSRINICVNLTSAVVLIYINSVLLISLFIIMILHLFILRYAAFVINTASVLIYRVVYLSLQLILILIIFMAL